MKQAETESRLSVRVPPKLKRRLNQLAKDDRRKVAEYVRLVLEDHVASKETK